MYMLLLAFHLFVVRKEKTAIGLCRYAAIVLCRHRQASKNRDERQEPFQGVQISKRMP
jgi:hypothetical protein